VGRWADDVLKEQSLTARPIIAPNAVERPLHYNLRGLTVILGLGLVLFLIVAFLYAHGPDDATTRHRPRMLFLHGMESRYQGTSPAQIEAAARRYAQARGYDLETIDISGDYPAQQEATARALIEKGGIDAVLGFSAGGYTADRLQKRFPNLTYIKIGAPGTSGDIEIPGVNHMELPGALADK
jgi:hypothetical protein